MRKRLKVLRDVERKLIHRVLEGTKGMNGKGLAAFIIQNAAEGFARGLAKEVRNIK